MRKNFGTASRFLLCLLGVSGCEKEETSAMEAKMFFLVENSPLEAMLVQIAKKGA